MTRADGRLRNPCGASALRHAPLRALAIATYWWEVRDPQDELGCVTVYKRNAVEVVRRLPA